MLAPSALGWWELCHHNCFTRSDGIQQQMANAEKLLHEAQYAFQCISFGESRENTRNRSRAKSLCTKIIRGYPTSMEAGEAHAILRRLGEEAYSSKMRSRHVHIEQSRHHSTPASMPEPRLPRTQTSRPQTMMVGGDDVEMLNWSGLMGLIFRLPKAVIGIIALAGFFLFGILGPFLFVPLVLFVLFTGPFRQMLKPEQRREMNAFVVRVNDYIENR